MLGAAFGIFIKVFAFLRAGEGLCTCTVFLFLWGELN